ncbi:SMP-30/gluconolactonase/LRE family protein [Ginsengibacter hankyongi]|uniref:SMP-30/gluconolactonase/LRE family protein n=1 Tax=Ginsengibacter hankyongi TaxID=2607284 RepID=A0A5J5IKH0_9BACT|nr:SMP-30/gluconolactonase/LRE family protein [Ginsengibacter hankyongi]KAA9040883.1 SMP-30/gluconolactonase/LRE family protein [Ginsengibacter hankyongi]
MQPNSPADTIINDNKIANGTPVLISDKFSFTEGPAVDKQGNVFFTDQPNNQIWKYSIDGKLSLFMDNTGRSNGMYFDKKGNLISCADEHNKLVAISPSKAITVLADNFNGEIFNGPNDVWINPVNDDIYFTDPYYKRDYWEKDHPHIAEQNVYYLQKNKKKAVLAAAEMTKPNGIIGTPDGKFLYVADIGANKTYKFTIDKNGSLINKQLFASQGSDGMTIDNKGNIYLTGKGITVYNKEGEIVQQIPIREDWTANVCFGGKNHDELFITASKSVYILHTNVKGVQ